MHSLEQKRENIVKDAMVRLAISAVAMVFAFLPLEFVLLVKYFLDPQ